MSKYRLEDRTTTTSPKMEAEPGGAFSSEEKDRDAWAEFEPDPVLGEEPGAEKTGDGAHFAGEIIISPEQFAAGIADAVRAVNGIFPRPLEALRCFDPAEPGYQMFAAALYRRIEVHAPFLLQPGSQARMDWIAIGVFGLGLGVGIRSELSARSAERRRAAQEAMKRQHRPAADAETVRTVNTPPEGEGPGADQGPVILGTA